MTDMTEPTRAAAPPTDADPTPPTDADPTPPTDADPTPPTDADLVDEEEEEEEVLELEITHQAYDDLLQAYRVFKRCRTAHENSARISGEPPLTAVEREAYNAAYNAYDESSLELLHHVLVVFREMEDE